MDQLQIFLGGDFVVNHGIRIRQPTIREIAEYGEQKYFSVVRTLTSTPADRKVEIWDSLHAYWDTIDEFELFVSVFASFRNMDMSIIFPDLDFNSFKPLVNPTTNEFVLINCDGVKIDRSIYTVLTDVLRAIHQLKKNNETGYNDVTKDCMIEDDRYDYESNAKKQFKSIILPFASYLAVRNGFSEIGNVPIGAFFYEMIREQRVKNYDNLMYGVYSGGIDIKKINKNELNWMGDI